MAHLVRNCICSVALILSSIAIQAADADYQLEAAHANPAFGRLCEDCEGSWKLEKVGTNSWGVGKGGQVAFFGLLETVGALSFNEAAILSPAALPSVGASVEIKCGDFQGIQVLPLPIIKAWSWTTFGGDGVYDVVNLWEFGRQAGWFLFNNIGLAETDDRVLEAVRHATTRSIRGARIKVSPAEGDAPRSIIIQPGLYPTGIAYENVIEASRFVPEGEGCRLVESCLEF